MILYGDCVKEELKKEIENSKYYKKVHFYLYSNKDDIPSFYYLKGIKRTLTELSIPLDLNKNDKGNIDIFKTNSKDKMVVLARPLPSDYENKLIPLIDSITSELKLSGETSIVIISSFPAVIFCQYTFIMA